MEIQAWLSAALAALHNFIHHHESTEDQDSSDDDEDKPDELNEEYQGVGDSKGEGADNIPTDHNAASAMWDSIAQAMWVDYQQLISAAELDSTNNDNMYV